MIEPARRESGREAIDRRQLEIERCLAAHGLMPQRRVLRDVTMDHDDGRFQRLRAALIDLGPVFSSFGIYLASRADLLPVKHCLELAAIPNEAVASPVYSVRELIDTELGFPQSGGFAEFDETPFESRLLFQSHRARLFDGEIVTVKILHPEIEGRLDQDLELLSVLGKVLADLGLDGAIEDFRRTLKQQTDFFNVAALMAGLYKDSPSLELRRVPLSRREFCTSRVLTFEYLPGLSLDNFKEIYPSDLGNRLLLVWLEQSLLNGTFPVDPRQENILVVQGQQIVFTGGSFAKLSPDVKTNLYEYLIAVANQDPDRACSCLIREMKRSKRTLSEDELRHRMRQVVPFRDGGWTNNGDGAGLAEYLFVHWRVAHECGFSAHPLALNFFRGLFQVTATARRLTTAGDPLLRALQDLRMEVVFEQVRELMTLNQLSDRFDKYAAIMADFPERLNHALTLAAEGSRLKHGKPQCYPPKGSQAISIGLLFLLVAVALLSRHFSVGPDAKFWVDTVSGVVFLTIGAVLMRVACRG